MHGVNREIEDRIFAMLGTNMTTPEITAAVGFDADAGLKAILKVIDERGTPNIAAAQRGIERLAAVRFV